MSANYKALTFKTRKEAAGHCTQLRRFWPKIKPVHIFGCEEHSSADKNGGVWVLCTDTHTFTSSGLMINENQVDI